jgi:DNA polymerase-3 subunit gamma/tau
VSASYRLHRPKDFASFIGQRHVLAALEGALRGDGQHAYLLAGPRGSGKTSLARIYARALCCEHRHEAGRSLPCNECASCVAHLAGAHPDIVEIDAAAHSGVDQIRERVIAPAAYLPLLSDLRVFVLDEAHMLSPAATAALLKLLEEPPAHLVFVLCSTDAHRIPITLRDRCWQFTLAPGSDAELLELLKRVAPHIDTSAARLIARHATGSYRQALTMLDTLVAACGEHFDTADTIRTLRLASSQWLAGLYGALAAADHIRLLTLVDELSGQVLDAHALLVQMEHDCYRGLRGLYGDDVGAEPVLIAPAATPAAQLRAWRYLQDCQRTLQRDSELGVAMAVLGLASL